jgi:putative transposase
VQGLGRIFKLAFLPHTTGTAFFHHHDEALHSPGRPAHILDHAVGHVLQVSHGFAHFGGALLDSLFKVAIGALQFGIGHGQSVLGALALGDLLNGTMHALDRSILAMFPWLNFGVGLAVGLLRSRCHLLLENAALRHQLLVLSRKTKRPRFRPLGRLFWVWLSAVWSRWTHAIRLVGPDTVIRCHRHGFRLFWRWKSRAGKAGRNSVAPATIQLIRQMSRANPLWGAPRIHGELLKLGISVAQRTVGNYMIPCPRSSAGETWTTFLRNHLGQMVSVDFLTVPTLRFEALYVFVVLSHARRQVLHFNVTGSPSASWVAQQLREALAFSSPPKYLLRDRDSIYGLQFQHLVQTLGLEELWIAPRSPSHSPYAERFIGSLRRECLDHAVVLGQGQLYRLVQSYLAYHHGWRTHLGLDKDPPEPRRVQPPGEGKSFASPEVGGLHHHYERRAD